MNNNLLKLKIRKSLGRGKRSFLLNIDISVSLDKNVIIFGPSGSGKSLTMLCLTGLMAPNEGIIQFKDEIFFSKNYNSEKHIFVKPQKRKIGYLPQNYALFPHLTLLQNVAYAKSGLTGKFLSNKLKKEAFRLLKIFNLSDKSDNYPDELSGGEKQRGALARAINLNPQLLLLDEPFSALDPGMRRQLRKEMKEMLKEADLPVIMITHDPEDVDFFCQTLILYNKGNALTIPNYHQIRESFNTAEECLTSLEKEWDLAKEMQ